MKKMDWRKARKFAASEEKYKPGKVMGNGRVVSNAPRDSLDARARMAERYWRNQKGLNEDLK